MKKNILIVVLFLFSFFSQAQTYKIKVAGYIGQGKSSCGTNKNGLKEIRLFYQNGSSERLIHHPRKFIKQNFSYEKTLNISKRVTRVEFHTITRRNSWRGCKSSKEQKKKVSVGAPCFSKRFSATQVYKDGIDGWVQITINPIMNISFSDGASASRVKIGCESSPIGIRATSGFNSWRDVYTWEFFDPINTESRTHANYQKLINEERVAESVFRNCARRSDIDRCSRQEFAWERARRALRSYSGPKTVQVSVWRQISSKKGQSNINLSLSNIYPRAADRQKALTKNIVIRVKPSCTNNYETNKVTVQYLPDPPKKARNPLIKQPTCSYSTDASFTLYFNRQILGHEKIDFNLKKKNQVGSYIPVDNNTGITSFSRSGSQWSYKWRPKSGRLLGGDYKVEVTGFNRRTGSPLCEKYSYNFKISAPPKVVFRAVKLQDETCYNKKDGKIKITASGGSGRFYYSLDTGRTWSRSTFTREITLTNKVSGPYNIRLKDTKGCVDKTKSNILITIGKKNKILHSVNTAQTKHPRLPRGNDGSVTISSVSGGTKIGSYYNYRVFINGSTTNVKNGRATASGFTVTGLPAGTHKIRYTDRNNCTQEYSLPQIRDPKPITFNVTSVQPSCYQGNGRINVGNILGGYPNYTVIVKRAGTTINTLRNIRNSTFVNVLAGNYTVLIKDTELGQLEKSIRVNPQSQIVISNINVQPIKCSNGKARVIVSARGGKSGRYQYGVWKGTRTVWQNSSVFSLGANRTSGYRFRVRDISSPTCMSVISNSVRITEPLPLDIRNISVTDNKIFNGSDGRIVLTIRGGTPRYSVTWKKKQDVRFSKTGTTISGLKAGFYIATIVDVNACRKVLGEIQVKENPKLNTSLTISSPIFCKNGKGSLEAKATGGSGSYTYKWYRNNVLISNRTSRISNVAFGKYAVVVNDGYTNGIRIERNLVEPGRIILNVTKTDVTCNGTSNGTITITGSGGDGNYFYSIDNKRSYHSVSSLTNKKITGLAKGIYDVWLKDGKGCEIDSAKRVSLTEPLSIAINSTSIVDCFIAGANTGSININVQGGKAGYGFLWKKIGSGAFLERTQNISGLYAGTYEVEVTDQNRCKEVKRFEINEPLPIQVTIKQTKDILCFSDDTASLLAEVKGGYPISSTPADFDYQWYLLENGTPRLLNSNKKLISISSLKKGTYRVTVNDSKGARISTDFRVNEPGRLEVSLGSKSNVNCFNSSDGSIDINVIGGIKGYNYSWFKVGEPSFSFTGEDVSNLKEGKYFVKVVDANACKVTSNEFEITQPMRELSINNVDIENLTGFETNNGSISVIIKGGTQNYTYKWTAFGETNSLGNKKSISNLKSGKYKLEVVDGKGCSIEGIYEISQPDKLEVVEIKQSKNILCFGEVGVQLKGKVQGGTPLYKYSWKRKGTSQIISDKDILNNVGAGTYVFEVIDNNLIKTIKEHVIVEPNKLEINTIESNRISCYKGADGSIKISIKGGVKPYTYSWQNGSTGTELTNLLAGDYKVTIRDKNLCEISEVIKVMSPLSELKVSTIEKKDATGFGLSNGTIRVIASGGYSNYTYEWKDSKGITLSSNTNELLNVKEGNYKLKVKDEAGCVLITNYTINEPELLKVTVNESSILCNGGLGSLKAVVSGGVIPYKYVWKNVSDEEKGRNIELVSILSGVYSLEVTDAKDNKTRVANIHLTEPELLEINTIEANRVSCYKGNDGSIKISAKGGVAPYTYNWQHGTTGSQLTGLLAGDYTVTIRDRNLCETVKKIKIAAPISELKVEIVEKKDVTGAGLSNGLIRANAIGGYSNYTYEWKDAKGIVLSSKTNELLNISGGNYELKVTDEAGCISITSYSLAEPELLIVSVDQVFIKCKGDLGKGNAIVSGGVPPYQYSWKNIKGEQISIEKSIEDLIPGVYGLEVIDANKNKVIVSNINLTEPKLLEFDTVVSNRVSCFGGKDGSIKVLAKGGVAPYTYNWKHGASGSELTNLLTGKYTVTIRDRNLCEITQTIKVLSPLSKLTVSTIEKKDVTGFGLSNGLIRVNVAGGYPNYTYEWKDSKGVVLSSNTNELLNISGDSYELKIKDDAGCVLVANYVIGEPNLLETSVEGTSVVCKGDLGILKAIVLGGVAPYEYVWKNVKGEKIGSEQILENLIPGVYALSVIDANRNKVNISRINLTEPELLEFKSVVSNRVSCYTGNDGNITVSVKGGVAPYTYNWQHGASGSELVNLLAGDYTVTVRDKNLCEITQTIKVLSPLSELRVSTIEKKNVTGFGLSNGLLRINVSGGYLNYTYEWKDSKGTVLSSNTNELLNISGDSYELKIKDEAGCILATNYTITEPLPLVVSVDKSLISCNGGFGSLKANVSGGVAPYEYFWINSKGEESGNSIEATNLVSEIYHLKVIDTNKNEISISGIDLNQPDLLEFNSIVTNNVSCYGGNDGSINVSVKGGVAPYNYKWTHTSLNTNVLENLEFGTYSVEVIDKNGCSITNKTIEIKQPNQYEIVDTNLIRPSVDNGTDGIIKVRIVGGVAPYNYTWEKKDEGIIKQEKTLGKSNEANSLGEGIYTVTVVDANNCSITETYNLANPGELLIAVEQLQEITCFNNNSAVLDVITIGGVGGNKYTWYNVKDDSVVGNKKQLSNVSAGNYYIIVDNAEGITEKSSAFEVKEPQKIKLEFSKNNLSCFESNDGSFKFKAKGGSNNYEFRYALLGETFSEWKEVTLNLAEVSNLKVGEYKIQLKDNLNCYAVNENGLNEFNIKISQPLHLNISLENKVNPTGFGLSNGLIEVSLLGGTLPYSYVWEDSLGNTLSSSNSVLTKLKNGIYTLKITDSKGCQITESYELIEPAKLEVSINRTSIISCEGSNNGKLEANVTGGVSGYTYKWYKEGTTISMGDTFKISNLKGGIYYVKVTDAEGNIIESEKHELKEPTALTLDLEADYVLCGRDLDWTIKSTVKGGTAPYSYLWNTKVNTSNLVDIASGVYELTVVDINGCRISKEITLVSPEVLEVVEENKVSPTGFGLSNGSIEVSLKGGTAPYNYVWEDSSGNSLSNLSLILNNLTNGIYTLKVTDSKGCQTTESYELIGPAKLEVSINTTSIISCEGSNNGELEANVIGGISGYTYKWYKEGTTLSIGDTFNVSNLETGTYYVVVTDLNGNIIESEKYELKEPTVLTLDLEADYVLCGRGLDWTIKSTVTGGTAPYSYLWNTGGNPSNLVDITSGFYELTVVDKNGCRISKEITLTSPEVLEIVEGIRINPTGFGLSNGAIEVSLKGGTAPYSYVWEDSSGNTLSNSSLTLNNLIDGLYTLKVTDSKGCQTTENYELIEPAKLEVSINRTSIISCEGSNNGELEANVRGGVSSYTYKWYKEGATISIGDTFNISNLEEGLYYVAVADSKGNTIESEKYALKEPAVLTLDLDADYVFCGRGLDWTIKSTITGGTAPYSYLWNTKANTSNLLDIASGVYELTIVDTNGCRISEEITLVSPEILKIIEGNRVNPTGFGLSNGSIEASLEGGTAPYSYVWEDSSGNVLSNSSLTLNNLIDGVYTLKVTDSKGCQVVESYKLIEPAKLEVNISRTSIITCQGSSNGELQAQVRGGVLGYNYKWYKEGMVSEVGNEFKLSSLGAGTYYVMVEDSKQNVVTSTKYVLTEPLELNVELNSDYTLCGTGKDWTIESLVTGGTAPYSYLWNIGSSDSKLVDLTIGSYSLTVVDANGCLSKKSITLVLPEALEISKEEIIDPICFNGSDGKIVIDVKGGFPPYFYNWSNSSNYKNLENVSFGSYELIIKDSKGCEIKQSFVINNPDKIKLDLGKDVTLCNGQTYILDGRIENGVTYSWSSSNGFSSTDALVEISEAGTYTVKATSNLGCEVTDEIEIKKSNIEISSNFIMSSQVYTNTSFVIVNVSSPNPEEVFWILPKGATIKEMNNSFVEIFFEEEGEYEITLMTKIGDCEEYKTNKLLVLEKEIEDNDSQNTVTNVNVINFINLYPNPSSGIFNLDVDLKEESPISVKIYRLNSSMIYHEKYENKALYELDYSFNLSSGVYFVLVETRKERILKKLIIK